MEGSEKLEVEVKILGIDVGEVMRKLSEIGITTKRVDQHDFVVLLSDREVLRIRKAGDRTKMTYKSRVEKGRFKVAEETEVEVSDFEKTRKIVSRICRGQKFYEYEKKRCVFEIDGVKGEIVELRGLEPYLELEGEREKIEGVIRKLGLENFERSSEGIPALLKRAGIKPERL